MVVERLGKQLSAGIRRSLSAEAQVIAKPVATKAAATVAKPVVRTAGAAAEREAVAVLAHANAGARRKAPALLAQKFERMAESRSAFSRGSIQLYAADLAKSHPQLFKAAGPKAPLVVDAHLGQLGSLVGPGGKLRFGIVDADEAVFGDVRIDLLNFAKNLRLVAREQGLSKKEADKAVRQFAGSYHAELSEPTRGEWPKAIEKFLKDVAEDVKPTKWLDDKAPSFKGTRQLARSATMKDVAPQTLVDLQKAFQHYKAGLPPQVARELAGHQVTDGVSHIAGIGSLGRGRFRVLTEATQGKGDAMIFELKEETAAAMAPYLGQAKGLLGEAQRAVRTNQLYNPATTALHGTTTLPPALALESPSFMVRRLVSGQETLDPTKFASAGDFADLATAAGQVLARGHASGSAVGKATAAELAGALPDKKTLAGELVDFAREASKQTKADHAAFVKALKTDPTLANRVISGR